MHAPVEFVVVDRRLLSLVNLGKPDLQLVDAVGSSLFLVNVSAGQEMGELKVGEVFITKT